MTSYSWFISCLSPQGLKQEPYDSGWVSGMVPLPPLEVTTGMFVASASSTRASSASERATPPPAYIRGMRDRAMTWAASRRSSGVGTIREMRAGSRSATSSRSTPASGGISIRTGRGRPGAQLSERLEHSVRHVPGPLWPAAATWSRSAPCPAGPRFRERPRCYCRLRPAGSGPQ